jgi:hypothetical protein
MDGELYTYASISRQGSVLLAAAAEFVTRAMPVEAGIIFTNISGVFNAPVGGVNSGVGTSSFQTGAPGNGSTPDIIAFTPVGPVTRDCTFTDPTGPLVLGRFDFVNGQTVVDTAATSVQWVLSATALLMGVNPPERPVTASFSIGFTLTLNTMGDPRLDADVWMFPGIQQAVVINEDSTGQVSAVGRFVPQNFGSPPRDVRFELLGLPASGDSTVIPLPEPSTLTLSLISLSGLALRRRWQAGRRTRTPAR